jgi:hypothetical protein
MNPIDRATSDDRERRNVALGREFGESNRTAVDLQDDDLGCLVTQRSCQQRSAERFGRRRRTGHRDGFARRRLELNDSKSLDVIDGPASEVDASVSDIFGHAGASSLGQRERATRQASQSRRNTASRRSGILGVWRRS